MRKYALTREISDCFSDAIRVDPVPLDVAAARITHAAYREALAWLGAEVRVLPALSGQPDAVFVEDMAVVAGGRVLATRSGAEARRGEGPTVIAALADAGVVIPMMAPATLDGGDVLRVGNRLFVGLSGRTSGAGVAALAEAMDVHGLRVVPVPVRAGLHLKSAVSSPVEGMILVDAQVLDPVYFRAGGEVRMVPEGEGYAANTLGWGGKVLMPSGFPGTRALLAAEGLEVRELDTREIRKADGALTCMSIIYERP